MIAFVTLLLGLVTGINSIEVMVSGPVAAVEIDLDGAKAGRIDGPPWITRVDLGKALRPHELVARALDAQGREIARVSQWLNLPRGHAEAEIVLEHGDDGVPTAAVLTWQSAQGVNPAIRLTLDGQPLKVDKQGRARLPRRDLKSLHILTAELRFPSGPVVRKSLSFGGEYGSEVSTELTAVPVRVREGASLPPTAGLQGWFTANGRPVPVDAVEDGPGMVLVVRLPSHTEVETQIDSPHRSAILPRRMFLGEDDEVRFLSLSPKVFASSKGRYELFDMTADLSREQGGLYWLLNHFRESPSPAGGGRRVADAVAVAGLRAARENHRRAVVLVLGRDLVDTSGYDSATVRAYLDSIRVPLFVWSFYDLDSPMAHAWGGAEDISTVAKLEQAVERLRADLDSQRIVWVEGRHLPQEIGLSSAAGVELVGGGR